MSKDPKFFDLIARRSLLVAILGVTVAVLPLFGLAFDATKKALVSVAVLVALIFWVIARWQERRVQVFKNYALYSLPILILVALVSGLISGAPGLSLIGLGVENYTVFALVLYSLLAFLVAYYFRTKKEVIGLVIGFSILSLVVLIFQVTRIALPFLFKASISFSDPSVNLIGKWNELGVFLGFSVLVSLLLLQVVKIKSTLTRKIVWTSLGGSLLALVIINYSTIWTVLAVFSVALTFYLSIFGDRTPSDSTVGTDEAGEKTKKKNGMWKPIMIVLIISLIFSTVGRPSTDGGPDSWLPRNIKKLNSKIGVNSLEVRPSLEGTWAVANQSLKANPIFGAGPNRFTSEWIKYKPPQVNATDFWAIDFQTGVGYWSTMALTLGGLGVVAIFFLLTLVLWEVVRAILAKQIIDPESYALLFLTATSTFYWWVFAVIYPVETVGLTLTFVTLGLLISTLVGTGMNSVREIDLTTNPKFKFASLFAILFLMISSVAGIYLVGQKYWGILTAQRAVYAMSVTGDINKADQLITSAIGINQNGAFLRQYAIIKMRVMDQLASAQSEDAEAATTQFQTVYGQAREALNLSQQVDKENYLNDLLLGRLLEKLAILKVPGAHEASLVAYKSAIALNPTNPGIYLDLARLEITSDNVTKGREYINQALTQKPNYIAAISLLSQLEADQGNLTKAVERASQAVTLAPNDEGTRFQLGFLLYQQGKYNEAISELTGALQLNPNFANAKYFLGLSYQEVGDKEKAIAIFEELSKLNPDNEEVKGVLEDLRSPVKKKEATKEEI